MQSFLPKKSTVNRFILFPLPYSGDEFLHKHPLLSDMKDHSKLERAGQSDMKDCLVLPPALEATLTGKMLDAILPLAFVPPAAAMAPHDQCSTSK
jgi:hypothetical protein